MVRQKKRRITLSESSFSFCKFLHQIPGIMTKRLPLFVLLLLVTLIAQAQHDQTAPIDSLLDHAKVVQSEKILLRVDLGSLFRWNNGIGWGGTARAGLEGKIGRNWTLLGEVNSRFTVISPEDGIPMIAPEEGGWSLVLAPRYYQGSLDRTAPANTATGFSARYWTVEISTQLMPSGIKPSGQTTFNSDNVSFSPMAGFQQRLWNIGYIDASFGLRVNYLSPDSQETGRWPLKKGWGVMPAAQIQVGLGVGG